MSTIRRKEKRRGEIVDDVSGIAWDNLAEEDEPRDGGSSSWQ
jgi:hypothetical protein